MRHFNLNSDLFQRGIYNLVRLEIALKGLVKHYQPDLLY
ncbi:Uncharacterised protein [Yersinia massiliensis]|nr:Uncharacterised protein [Yersinia massiliensis]